MLGTIYRDLRGDVRSLRGLELRARSVPLLDLTLAMGLYGENTRLPPVTWGKRKFEGFWPIENREKRGCCTKPSKKTEKFERTTPFFAV